MGRPSPVVSSPRAGGSTCTGGCMTGSEESHPVAVGALFRPDPAFVDALRATASRLAGELDLPGPSLEGKLLRPTIARAAAPPHLHSDPAFLSGALAIQMVHEASILHDDILDDSSTRRNSPSAMARHGIARCLVEGDHLLTAAYRVAHATGSLAFLGRFTRAVERTVAGERAQHAARGRVLSEAEYQEITAAKSGELFGCAVALPRLLTSRGEDHTVASAFDLGVRLGRFYQMVDDFLDLCPRASLGKSPLQDYRQGKWTWPLAEAGLDGFELDDHALYERLFSRIQGGETPMRSAFRRLELEGGRLHDAWAREFGSDEIVPRLIESWIRAAESTLEVEESTSGSQDDGGTPSLSTRAASPSEGPSTPAAVEAVRRQAVELGGAGDWIRYFGRHSRSFRFSARLFPPEEGRLVSGIYAFCRFTDDLVDGSPDADPAELDARIDAWQALIREAYATGSTGISLLDEVMGETARRGVTSLYAEELVRGVAMDIRPQEYPDLEALRRYSYRVASVVGLWLTELFGRSDPWVLRRAEAMGQAMQMTNILRDVGEDLRRGRLYLPLDHLDRFGLTRRDLERAAAGEGDIPSGYGELVETLMRRAEEDYAAAAAAIPALPIFFQRPVAVAGQVYRGIHQEIRANAYDNLRRRAYTSLYRKVVLGGQGLWGLRVARRSYVPDRSVGVLFRDPAVS
ncbi:MAG: hypothetical protein EA422_05370 [Gemmatimonadales bacterium]|nr:MAG: hypothetical protein EA422_05370 [Gemmatimonadales bacterium]